MCLGLVPDILNTIRGLIRIVYNKITPGIFKGKCKSSKGYKKMALKDWSGSVTESAILLSSFIKS